MPDTLEEKTLSEGSELSLIKYQLSEDEAEALDRPKGSYEIVLMLKAGRTIPHGATKPKASWYLGEESFRKLYQEIKTEEDFKNVHEALERVDSKQKADKILNSELGICSIIYDSSI